MDESFFLGTMIMGNVKLEVEEEIVPTVSRSVSSFCNQA